MSSSTDTKKDRLDIFGIIGIGLTTVIGSGIWTDPVSWANLSGIYGILAILIIWALFLCMGLAYSECIGMFPKGGGPYSYVSGAFNEKLGALVGIVYSIGYFFISSLLAFITTVFLNQGLNLGLDQFGTVILTFTLVILLAILTLLAKTPRTFGYVNFGWVALKILLIAGIGVLLLFNWSNPSVLAAPSFTNFQNTINSALWALMGLEVVLIVANNRNTENVKSTVPKGIIISLIVIIVVYLFVYIATVGVFGIGSLPDDPNILALLAAKIGLDVSILNLLAAFSSAGTAYVTMGILVHQISILAGDDILEPLFSADESDTNFVIFVGALIIIIATLMFMGIPFGVNNFVNTGLALILLSSALPAGFIALYLRFKLPAIKRPFKSPVGLLVFPLAIILSLYLVLLLFIDYATLWPALVTSVLIIVIFAFLIYGLGYFTKKEESETW